MNKFCKVCTKPIQQTLVGRTRMYCDDRCRRVAFDVRRLRKEADDIQFNDAMVAEIRTIVRIAEG